MTILIVTNKNDAHADAVIEKLREIGNPFLRFNTEDFPQRVILNFQTGTRKEGIFSVETPAGKITSEEIKSIWYRRPEDPLIHERVRDPSLRNLALSESKMSLRWIWGLLPEAFWVNNPDSNRFAGNKLVQAREASRLGFRVPSYIITNDPRKAKEFAGQHEEIVVKPIGSGLITREDGFKLTYTNRLSVVNDQQLELVQYTPTFLQEHLSKAYELRITVVGDEVFACRINSQDSEKTRDDWRRYDHDNVEHSSYQLPERVERLSRSLVNRFGLNFGAIDIIVTPESEYVFLEINPNGQWLWIENLTGMPISRAIAELLANPPTR